MIRDASFYNYELNDSIGTVHGFAIRNVSFSFNVIMALACRQSPMLLLSWKLTNDNPFDTSKKHLMRPAHQDRSNWLDKRLFSSRIFHDTTESRKIRYRLVLDALSSHAFSFFHQLLSFSHCRSHSFILLQLMQVLEDPENADVISWLPHGKGFIIYKKKKFASDVLPKAFKQSVSEEKQCLENWLLLCLY